MSAWADGFIAVDWGTTNRRAYLVAADGKLADEFEDPLGVLAVEPGGFEAAVRQVRERLGERPMLLAGMIGSNRGWIETPYVHCPAGLEELAERLVRMGQDSAVVPGVAFANGRFDVMRGEEVQILGAAKSAIIPPDCLVCHPGTHNKWVRMAGGRIESFRTVMTGELFALLKQRSILSELLDGEAKADGAFADGVAIGASGRGLSAELFEARARFLLGRLSRANGPSFVSGLLIGEDVRTGLADHSGPPVIVMGRPQLTALYSAALEVLGVESGQVDGEGAFIAGACRIVERIQ